MQMRLISDRLLSRLLGSGRPVCQIAPRGKTNWDLTTEPDLGKDPISRVTDAMSDTIEIWGRSDCRTG